MKTKEPNVSEPQITDRSVDVSSTALLGIPVWNPLDHGIHGVPLMVPAHEFNRLAGENANLRSDLKKAEAHNAYMLNLAQPVSSTDLLGILPAERKELMWNIGPSDGGRGTAGGDMWNDGDLLLVVVNLREGRATMAVRITCCDGEANMVMSDTGDECGWSVNDISWWAYLDDALPSMPNAKMSCDTPKGNNL